MQKIAQNTTLDTNFSTVVPMAVYIGDYNYWQPVVEQYCKYTCWPYWSTNQSKIEQAFKIVQKLIDKKLIKLATVKSFIEVVNNISEVL